MTSHSIRKKYKGSGVPYGVTWEEYREGNEYGDDFEGSERVEKDDDGDAKNKNRTNRLSWKFDSLSYLCPQYHYLNVINC